MFRKLLLWIREVIERMIGKTTITKALNVEVSTSPEMVEALELWTKLYNNQAPWLVGDMRSLNLPASVASEVAKLVTIEMEVEFTGGTRADWLQEQFDRFVMPQIRQQVEYAAAKGGMVFKPFITNKNSVAVDFVQADQFYPIEFGSDGNLRSAVFVDRNQIGDYWYTRLEYHAMAKDGVVVVNKAYQSTVEDMLGFEIALDSVAEWADIMPEATIKGVNKPLFAYFRYPMANNIDPNSSLGVSCYSRATELFEDADKQWNNLLWEFESGQRALFVDVLAFGKDAEGKPVLPNKRLYRTLDAGGQNDALFEEWSPTFREANILQGLDTILKKIEFSCGISYGSISDPQTVDRTATEIKISRQRTYATVVDTQKCLESALKQLAWAMDVWAGIGKLKKTGSGKFNVAFRFDDSVIVDREKQFSRDLTLVNSQIMSKLEFRMRNMGEDEKTAKEKLALVGAEAAEMPEEEGGMEFGR